MREGNGTAADLTIGGSPEISPDVWARARLGVPPMCAARPGRTIAASSPRPLPGDSMPRSLRLAVCAAALCALAIAAPAANADSIAYVKDGNVWLSTSDGGRQFQVTFDGGYADVSQADDGAMIALHGNHL